ncbi:hypothetical protein O3P69_005578, partial [Scylla paramamosain]
FRLRNFTSMNFGNRLKWAALRAQVAQVKGQVRACVEEGVRDSWEEHEEPGGASGLRECPTKRNT